MKDKKAEIFKAVYELLDHEDISEITVSKIAEKANIGKGTVYEYFNSKEDVFCSAIEAGMDHFIHKMRERLLTCSPSFRDAVYTLFDMTIEMVEGNRTFINLLADSPASFIIKNERRSRTRNRMESFKQEINLIISTLLEKAVQSGDINRTDELRQRLVLPMFMSFVLRVSGINISHEARKEIDPKREKEEMYDILLKVFS